MKETENNFYKDLLIKYINHIEWHESYNYIEGNDWKKSGILTSDDASIIFNIINNDRINKRYEK